MAYLFAVMAFSATLGGGLAALRVQDRLHLLLGAAAGLMLGVVGFDLLPEAMRLSHHEVFSVPVAALTLVGGFFSVHVLERSLARQGNGGADGHVPAHGEQHHGFGVAAAAAPDRRSVGLLAGGGLVLHSLLDGVGIGLGFQAGGSVGVAVAIAVIAHDCADGFNTFTITSLYGNARRRALTLLGLDALAPVAGVAVASQLSLSSSVVGGYLGYFAGFLLYLATADILPEAHARHPSRMTLACTVAGAGLMWLVVGLSG